MSDAELLATMSDSVSMQTYAKCSAAFGRSSMMLIENKDALIEVSALYFQKAVQLSSNQAAAESLTRHQNAYFVMMQQSGAAYLKALKADIDECNKLTNLQ